MKFQNDRNPNNTVICSIHHLDLIQVMAFPCFLTWRDFLLSLDFHSAKAEFVFVSPSQSSDLGEVIVLKCVGTGVDEPVVEWYNEDTEVVAVGRGSAVLAVTVERSPQRLVTHHWFS